MKRCEEHGLYLYTHYHKGNVETYQCKLGCVYSEEELKQDGTKR